MSEEEFKKLSLCNKVKVLSSQVLVASKENAQIPLCFFAASITKLYNILFSTFWLLFIQSFYPNGADNDFKDAKMIYSNVMIVSVCFGILFVPLMAKVADSCNPQWVLPIAFYARAASFAAFYFIVSPSGYYSYGVSVLLVLFSGMENIANDSILLRSADKEIRGVIYGVANACGFLGMLAFSICGGYLFDSISPYAPFMLVGALDLFFAVIATLLSCCGIIKNDLLEREVKRRLATGE
jgi:hypothetical protein